MRDRKCVKFTDRETSRRAVEWNERAEAAANRRGKGLEKGGGGVNDATCARSPPECA